MTLAAALVLSAVSLGACSHGVQVNGQYIEDHDLAPLRVGESHATEVLEALGTPTAVSTFDERTWYYIGQLSERRAFMDPDIIDRRVIIVRFDSQGTLGDIDERGLEDGQDIEMVDRETPSMGRTMGFLEQMIGNIGRFNPAESFAGQ